MYSLQREGRHQSGLISYHIFIHIYDTDKTHTNNVSFQGGNNNLHENAEV